MRPVSVRYFEAAVVTMILFTALNWVLVYRQMPFLFDPSGPYLLQGVIVPGTWLLMILTLWFLIARRASIVAKWIYVVLTTLNLLSFPALLAADRLAFDVNGVLSFLTLVAMLIAAGMLHRADSRAWFEGKPPVDPEIFR